MHSSVCGPLRYMTCSSCKTSNPTTVRGLNHSYPYKTRLAVIISVKILKINANIKDFRLMGAAWGVGDRRDPTQVLGQSGWSPWSSPCSNLAPHWYPGEAGRKDAQAEKEAKAYLWGCLRINKLFLPFGHSPFFPSDFWSEFTLRPKAPQDLFPLLNFIACGKTFHSSWHMQPAHD